MSDSGQGAKGLPLDAPFSVVDSSRLIRGCTMVALFTGNSENGESCELGSLVEKTDWTLGLIMTERALVVLRSNEEGREPQPCDPPRWFKPLSKPRQRR